MLLEIVTKAPERPTDKSLVPDCPSATSGETDGRNKV